MVVRVETGSPDIIMEPKNKKKKSKKDKKGSVNEESSGATKGQVPIMEGMSASETTMIRRLAGNDPLIRKKTVKKLRKWLNAVAQRTSDAPGCRDVVEPNTVRVWKALFYCMWMADKPLPQEQLAEHISDLVGIFSSKPHALLVFVEWFFRTMAREWSWIDRLRLDKFMMLVRRFLRKTLSVLAEQKWKADTVDGLIKILKVHVFNHHPQVKIKKGEAQEPTVNCPVGFQIHMIDIFLEEVAKVDADGLKSPKVLKLVSLFIHELATNDDERILDEIRERVFHHLMRQSDVGMDYQEALMYGDMEYAESDDEANDNSDEDLQINEEEEGSKEGDNEEADDSNEVEDEEMDVEDDIAGMEDDKGPLDPRAGAVDVVLPQLEVDYNILAEKLTEAGGQKTIKKKNRGLLYTLATQFREIVQGNYPLALPEAEPQKPIISQKDIKKATKRLVEATDSGTSKKRKTKKQRRRDAKRAAGLGENDSCGSEDMSKFLTDGDLMDHVSDNYASYMHEQMEANDGSQEDEEEGSEPEEEPVAQSPKRKNKEKEKKLKGKKYKTVIEVESDELDAADLSPTISEDNFKTDSISNGNNGEVVLIRRPKSSKKNKSRQSDPLRQIQKVTPMKAKHITPVKVQAFPISSKNVTPVGNNIITLKKGGGGLKTPVLGTPVSSKLKGKLGATPNASSSTGGSGFKKRVSFVLARNKEHEATDYMGSIQSSPAIPFDAEKTPNSGLLKATKSSPARFISSPRKIALDFF